MAAEPWRPVLRTEEAAEWSASPVSSRASSSFLPADRPASSIDSLASLPSSDAVSDNVLKVVKTFLLSMGMVFPCVLLDQSTFASICAYAPSSIRGVTFGLVQNHLPG